MQEAKVYHGKLVNLKKEMNALMEKSTKLKVSFQWMNPCIDHSVCSSDDSSNQSTGGWP